MMTKIGNFFFTHRNWAFIPLYLSLFLPSPEIMAANYHFLVIIIGLFVTVLGQIIRGGTIGLAYIKRGGLNKKVYAENLVTEGMFSHCRNPLYIGNILMLTGIGILDNSLIFIGLVLPIFIFIFQSIILAEENFLQNKFGELFETYCRTTNRWIPDFKGLTTTFQSMEFNWRRWLLKEYSSLFIWLLGIVTILLYKYPELTSYQTDIRNHYLITLLAVLTASYFSFRYLKKSGRLTA